MEKDGNFDEKNFGMAWIKLNLVRMAITEIYTLWPVY